MTNHFINFSKSFKLKVQLTDRKPNGGNIKTVEIMVPLKYKGNCEINFMLTWKGNCVLSPANEATKLAINDVGLNVPAVDLTSL